MSIVSKEYHTISQIAGPLVFVEKTEPVGYQEPDLSSGCRK